MRGPDYKLKSKLQTRAKNPRLAARVSLAVLSIRLSELPSDSIQQIGHHHAVRGDARVHQIVAEVADEQLQWSRACVCIEGNAYRIRAQCRARHVKVDSADGYAHPARRHGRLRLRFARE